MHLTLGLFLEPITAAVAPPGGGAYCRPSRRRFGLQRGIPSPRARSTGPSPHRGHAGCGNVDPLRIGCPYPVRLSTRLTPGRLTLPGKPWSYGGGVSHAPYRYSCLHLLFRRLHTRSPWRFAAAGMLPYRHCCPAASAARLMPVYYRCRVTRPVSCYALFKCIAASKQTSRLSSQPDHLSPT